LPCKRRNTDVNLEHGFWGGDPESVRCEALEATNGHTILSTGFEGFIIDDGIKKKTIKKDGREMLMVGQADKTSISCRFRLVAPPRFPNVQYSYRPRFVFWLTRTSSSSPRPAAPWI